MQQLNKLLKIENSELAKGLRFGLRGLRASLRETLEEETNSDDPGASACRDLLRELDLLLEPPTSKQEDQTPKTVSGEDDSRLADFFEPVAPQDNSPPLSSTVEFKLHKLRQAFVEATELRFYLGEYGCETLSLKSDRDLWEEVQRLLLRVPVTVAQSWRERAQKLANEAGFYLDDSQRSRRGPLELRERGALPQLPFSRDELVYPGFTGTFSSSELYREALAVIETKMTEGTLSEDLQFLAGVVLTCIEFIAVDKSLHHALKSVYRFSVQSLVSESEQHKYITAAIDRLERAIAAERDSDPVASLRSRLDLDEAIHSLVYLPPVDRDSWWGKLQQECRRTLKNVAQNAREAGCQVQTRALWGTYADVCNFSKDDLKLDRGGIPGEVSACLRVYAKINEEVLPGRVLFRSLANIS